MFTPLTGRTVLVTGGTKGIGKGIAGVFARAGANVVVAGRDRETRRGGRPQELGGRAYRDRATSAKAADCERMVGRDGRADSAASTSCARTPASSPTSSSRT